MSDHQMAGQVCVRCGASSAPEAHFCGCCGLAFPEKTVPSGGSGLPDASLLSGWSHADAVPLAVEAYISGGYEPAQEQGIREAEQEGGSGGYEVQEEQVAQKRCAWCSGLNQWAAVVCEHCGAHFPVPEQDEAFRRAAEERMRQDLESLNFWIMRRRRGWRRFLF